MNHVYRANIKVFQDGREIHSGESTKQAASEGDAKAMLEAQFRSKYPGAEVTVTSVRKA